MADLAITIAGNVITAIGSEAIQKICSSWGYKDDLEELNKTITTIKNVLLDADSKRDLTNVQQGYIAELKDVVYDADDLFDEFQTLVLLNQIGGDKGGMFFGKVRRFFSSKKGKLGMAYRMSHRVEEIKGHLDDVANNYTRFGFSVDYKPIVRRREDSCSYVDVNDIIGRDNDKDAIIDLLLASNDNDDDESFRFLTIVGMGGLGKTALAQLVFNNDKVKNEFSSSRFWVCVSDQDGVEFNVKLILSKILEIVNGKMIDNTSSMEFVHNQFREKFRTKKYLLVLDDVWNEDHDNWEYLKKFLMMGAMRSRIVVTSRSEKTGSIIGSKHVYKLEGLSIKDSQRLFEMSALDEVEKHPELVKIGENIVRKCCGIPLAIKVIGSLLYGHDIGKWQSIERSGLNDIGKDNSDKILPILKLSYFNLAPSLKSCFSYCALFPKDFNMRKEMLIGLWIAQGYIVPLDGGQSIEDAAEEHFLILMRRCFFQDICKDTYGNIVYVKIHDLMHDVAQEVGKDEIGVVSSIANKLGEKIRHMNIIDDNYTEISFCRSKIRSFICNGSEIHPYKCYDSTEHLLNKQVELTALRVLDFAYLDIKTFHPTIDNLLLLRYVNLSYNQHLEVLPNSITRLHNLQTLLLRNCRNLREVPRDFSNLINLRHLDLYGCDKLNGMPLGILKLGNLSRLPYFIEINTISEEELSVLQQVFSKFIGEMSITSSSIKPLLHLNMQFEIKWHICEDVLKKLELPPYIHKLHVSNYISDTITWPKISPQHYLTHIEIKSCSILEQVPVLSKFLNLKSLKLGWLSNVEYMEKNMRGKSNDTKAEVELFPSLEYLEISWMKKLEGWWKGDPSEMKLKFPRLSHLIISECPNLALNLVCPPSLEKLELRKNSERLVIFGEMRKLREIVIDNMDHLKLIASTNNSLTSLELRGDIEVESALELVQSWATSLQTLTFTQCKNLKKLPRLDHFIALEKLALVRFYELSICEDDDDDDEDTWKSMSQSLRHLEFDSLYKMKILPKRMQHLTSLKSLKLFSIDRIEGLPEWMCCLSSLQSLYLSNCLGIKSLPEAMKDLNSLEKLSIQICPSLEERLEMPHGEDFPKIKHIPNFDFLGRDDTEFW